MYIGLYENSWLMYFALAICVIGTVIRNEYWFNSIGLLLVAITGQYLSLNNIVNIVIPEVGFVVINLITLACIPVCFLLQVIIGLVIRDLINFHRAKK